MSENLKPFFAISSSGGALSQWLTAVLNTKGHVVCFPVVEFSPFGFEDRRLKPEELLTGLSRLAFLAIPRNKTFGTIHSLPGAKYRRFTLELGGTFGAVFRHPIDRIHSLFSAHFKNALGQRNDGDNIYAAVGKTVDSVLPAEAEGFFPDFSENTAVELFYSIANSAVTNDMENFESTSEQERIFFEKVLSDEDYLAPKLPFFAGGQPDEWQCIVGNHLEKQMNAHHQGKRFSTEELFDQWPESFKRLFLLVVAQNGMNRTISNYENLGYGLPENFISYMEQKTDEVAQEVPQRQASIDEKVLGALIDGIKAEDAHRVKTLEALVEAQEAKIASMQEQYTAALHQFGRKV